MTQVICLYSKYSPNCQAFLKDVSEHQFIQQVCLDNSKIRKKIMASKALAITKVPTIIVVREDGMVEKYDDTAKEWLDEISGKSDSSESTPSTPPQAPAGTTPLEIPQAPPVPPQAPTGTTPLEIPQPQPQPQQPQLQPQPPQPQPQPDVNMPSGVTPIPGMMDTPGGVPPPIEHQAMPPQPPPNSAELGGGGIMAAAEQMQRERGRDSGSNVRPQS